MPKIVNFLGKIEAKKMRPTLKHRPAIWENMLGTVFAMNDKLENRYFDYNWDGAAKFAGISKKKDIRIFKQTRQVNYGSNPNWMEPRFKQTILWVEKGDKS
jgi:hypothetical protein